VTDKGVRFERATIEVGQDRSFHRSSIIASHSLMASSPLLSTPSLLFLLSHCLHLQGMASTAGSGLSYHPQPLDCSRSQNRLFDGMRDRRLAYAVDDDSSCWWGRWRFTVRLLSRGLGILKRDCGPRVAPSLLSDYLVSSGSVAAVNHSMEPAAGGACVILGLYTIYTI
jgi:hypothetical protein